MGNKNTYNYTIKLDKEDHMEIYNEEGKLDSPENSIAYLLVGLLSCMSLTAKSMLQKMQINYEKIIVEGKLSMVDVPIRHGSKIECKMSLEGGPVLLQETKERLAQLTKKYCTVSVTIESHPEMTLVME
jgi:uncharacterized OsmC-like protein